MHPFNVQAGAPFTSQKQSLQSSFQLFFVIQNPFESRFKSMSDRFDRMFAPAVQRKNESTRLQTLKERNNTSEKCLDTRSRPNTFSNV